MLELYRSDGLSDARIDAGVKVLENMLGERECFGIPLFRMKLAVIAVFEAISDKKD